VGFLFGRFGKLFGFWASPKAGIVLLTAGLFALLHYLTKGSPACGGRRSPGSRFGTIFAVTGRIWIPEFAMPGVRPDRRRSSTGTSIRVACASHLP